MVRYSVTKLVKNKRHLKQFCVRVHVRTYVRVCVCMCMCMCVCVCMYVLS
jgi:hypothetical protein